MNEWGAGYRVRVAGYRLQGADYRGVTINYRESSSALDFFNLQFIVCSLRLHFASNLKFEI